MSKQPLEIKVPIHLEHPLNLLAKPLYTCFCNTCGKRVRGSTYNCSSCKFDLCIDCADLFLQERTLKHDSHQHSLTLLQIPATFECDACEKQDKKELSYFCSTCPFWIHKSCASLPITINHDDHEHPLSLAYTLQFRLRHYQFKCEVCHKQLNPSRWLYHCERCRYFVHVKCNEKTERALTDTSTNGHLLLPWKDMSVAVIKPFILEECKEEIQLLSEISHFSHEHPLILSNAKVDKENNDEETLCDACIEPISTPYYSCNECHFFLHLSCANLPTNVLMHPNHPDHELSLKKFRSDSGYFYCKICHDESNGFFYECEPCKFQIDLFCTFLPRDIIHKAHKHPLMKTLGSNKICEACGRDINGLAYCCLYFCEYYLHRQCATLPCAIIHKWDNHLLTLMYPPFGDHPDEFYCEICEEEIHPKQWLYHCPECDQSFHSFCIPRLGKDRFIKFGNTLQVNNHQHFLTSVRESRFKSSCSSCCKNLYGDKAFECGPCKFFLCYGCACNIPPEPLPFLEENPCVYL